ncbi:hypothetical protein [Neorickettsia sp. 179522]|uniref:hypothetical protein n=1 Tax=Neorickettsia sp. 179522 TaxID=1714371 RepID=UPI00079A01A4|nr:hypothetical protein [Neorickettsia sp. 179522]KYH12263.1 hypothetical protein AS219_00295 [Neorickettsia sp. 179522]
MKVRDDSSVGLDYSYVRFLQRTAIVSLFFFLLSSVTILAVQVAKRIPWRSDSEVTKSWWCFVYLIVPGVVLVGSLLGMMVRGVTRVVGPYVITPYVPRRRTSRVVNAIESSLLCCSVFLILVLPLVLIPLGAVLDHKKDLSLTEKRVLAGIECALLGLFFLAFSSMVVLFWLDVLSYKISSLQNPEEKNLSVRACDPYSGELSTSSVSELI